MLWMRDFAAETETACTRTDYGRFESGSPNLGKARLGCWERGSRDSYLPALSHKHTEIAVEIPRQWDRWIAHSINAMTLGLSLSYFWRFDCGKCNYNRVHVASRAVAGCCPGGGASSPIGAAAALLFANPLALHTVCMHLRHPHLLRPLAPSRASQQLVSQAARAPTPLDGKRARKTRIAAAALGQRPLARPSLPSLQQRAKQQASSRCIAGL